MASTREELLERITRAIDVLQAIQGDSHTPLRCALEIVEPLRELADCQDALREKVFKIAADDPRYAHAVAQLKKVSDTLATDLVAHQRHMELVTLAAEAAQAVLAVVSAVAAVA